MHICPQEIVLVLGVVPVVRWGVQRAIGWAKTRDREGTLAVVIGVASILAMIASLASGAEVTFEERVQKAADEQDVAAPRVLGVTVGQLPEVLRQAVTPTTIAFVLPFKPEVRERPVIVLLLDRVAELHPDLECVARHEVGHVKLGHIHGARTVKEERWHHQALSFWLKARYGNGQTSCPVEG